ncbi:MAG TPA: NUDIX domain-containing protein [Egibacteraceae bacterium]
MPSIADVAVTPVPARPAATVVLLRDGDDGPEVCLLRRHARSGFMPDAWVFPGGTVDPADRRLPRRAWTGYRPAADAARFGGDAHLALGLRVAAVRETFEEAGILLGRHRDGSPLTPEELASPRAQAARHGGDFVGWLLAAGIVLDLGALRYWRRWVTPTSEPRRYDTAFFLARAPHGQEAAHDAEEAIDLRWIRPAVAVAEADAGRLTLAFPTRRTLRELAAVTDVDRLLASVGDGPVRAVQPHVLHRADGTVTILHPDDPGFPEASRVVRGAW